MLPTYAILLHEYLLPTVSLATASVLGLVAAAAVPWGVKMLKKANISVSQTEETKAAAAVQMMVTNFAGRTANSINDGTLTWAGVKSGVVAADLAKYASETVGDSMTTLGVTPEVIHNMMLGKLAALPGVADAITAETAAKAAAGAFVAPPIVNEAMGSGSV
jgi:hypothetical protein